MPARDYVDLPVQALEITRGRILAQQREIPQMVNQIIGTDYFIPVFNQSLIHLSSRRKWAITIPDHVFVTEMGVGGEEDGHSL